MLLEFQYFAVDVVTGVSIEAGNQRISPPTSQSLPPTFQSLPPTFYIQFHLSCYITVILILLLNLMPEYRKWYSGLLDSKIFCFSLGEGAEVLQPPTLIGSAIYFRTY